MVIQQMLMYRMLARYIPQTVPTEREDAQQKIRKQEDEAIEKAVKYFAPNSGIAQTEYRERVKTLLEECARRHP